MMMDGNMMVVSCRAWVIFLLVAVSGSLGVTMAALAAETATAGWTPFERQMLRSLWLDSLQPLPPDPSNRFADDPKAAAFGQRIFFDQRFSSNNDVACATCHQPDKYFTDGLALSRGIGETARGAPSLIGTAYSPWLYWDGRRDSHWSQALVPLETPVEHGIDRHRVLARIAADDALRQAYEDIFGQLPGDDAEDEAINRAFANIGKAVAAFERRILPSPSRFDRYVEAVLNDALDDEPLLTSDEVAGLKLFLSEQGQCTRCHNGPLFSNYGFHNIGLIELKRGVRTYDFGRVNGIKEAIADPFRCDGPYSDAKPDECAEERFVKVKGRELAGAFKVPTLRNVAETAPYMHDGRFASLHDVLEHYREAPLGRLGHQELNPLDLTPQQINQLIDFLGTLTGPPSTISN